MSLRKKKLLIENLKTEMGSGKQRRWKITFHWPQSLIKKPFPREFTCPISLSLMADPVIVSSGHTLDRNCALICQKLGFYPVLSDGSVLNFSNIIPNLSLKTAIANWCKNHLVETPKPVDPLLAEKLIRKLMASQNHSESEWPRQSQLSSCLVEPVAAASATPSPLILTTRPACLSSSSSSDTETLNSNSDEFGDVSKLCSVQVSEQEEILITLRKITRTQRESRAYLCTPVLLSALRSLIISRYLNVQVNAVACLVNLSLEDQNKVKIVRSGIVPPLIKALKGGFPEAQDHAAGALFSLALDDQNKTAIGVLGALQPLLHCLRSHSEGAKHDSVLALCHLSLVQSNRTKLVKLGSVNVLLGMVKAGHLTSKVMLVLCNLALGSDGRDAMLDAGAVECFVGMLSRVELESESTRESCLVALYRLGYGGLRFRGLAKKARAEEVLVKAQKTASEKGREKAGKVLGLLQGKDEEEEVDWEELLK